MDQPNLDIDLANTNPINSPEGNPIFQQGFILRKVSKFITQTDEDGIMPLPVFFDASTGKILADTIPPSIREDYKDIIME